MTTASQEFDQLRNFLKEMFQFEDHDLDFGIYRIIRLKRRFIQNFIDGDGENSLRSTVARALRGVQNSQSDTARNWLSAFAATLGKKGEAKWEALAAGPSDPAAQAGFRALFELSDDQERELAEAQLKTFLETRQLSADDLEVRVYNHLLNFFELYYQNGDFGYNTRAASAFKVPYETDYDGSDTLFHWKHKDSYYIKTGNGFHSVRCEIGGRWLEFRLSGGEEEAQTGERNNNKESGIKHYRLLDIAPVKETDQEGTARTIWQVRFALAPASTPKVELYNRLWQTVFADERDLAPYLHKKPGKDEDPPGKPVFTDLADDYDKTDGGSVKGIGQLRLKFDKYVEELAKRDEFKDVGKNAADRQRALEEDATAVALWQIDRNLNKFYAGNDSDYFIHKDLRGFLTREKARFIKQVIFSDLEALLHAGEDNATTLIARAFSAVADTLIGFLSAIEDFQKGLFELKKKVVDTHYLISVGKIPAAFHARVFACEKQRAEWRDVFKLDITEAGRLSEHPTLVVDTSLYRDTDPGFQDDLLSLAEFDDLDEQTDGLLINSENWQALNLLQEKFREQIKCIYIDPPYNTGGDGFLYKDSFRHSSWVTMIQDRLDLAKIYMAENGAMFISIDQNERHNLDQVLLTSFGNENRVGEIIWKNVTDNNPTNIACEHEYIECYTKDKKRLEAPWKSEISDIKDLLVRIGRDLVEEHGETQELRDAYQEWYRENKSFLGPMEGYKFIDKDGVYCGSRSVHNPGKEGYRYDVPHKDNGRPCKQPLMGYRFPEETMKKLLAEDRIIFGEDEHKIIELKLYAQEYEDKLASVITLDGRSGANDIRSMFPGEKRFKNPKASALLETIFPFLVHSGDIVFDFFAGSGTTAQSVIALNRKDSAKRRFVLTEMATYFDDILKPRVAKVMSSSTWKDGSPVSLNGWEGLVKVQLIEQYEDFLDNLVPVWDDTELPKQVPVSYLFRPEQNALSATLDLSRPFAQTMRIGKKREEKTIDLMETWCYLQGYWIKSRRLYREFDRPYLAVETTHGALVVFRDIDDGEDDTANLNAILAKYADEHGVSLIQRLEVNHDADQRRLVIETTLITAADFMRGAQW